MRSIALLLTYIFIIASQAQGWKLDQRISGKKEHGLDQYQALSVDHYENTLVVHSIRLDPDAEIPYSSFIEIYTLDSSTGKWSFSQEIETHASPWTEETKATVKIYKNTILVGAYNYQDVPEPNLGLRHGAIFVYNKSKQNEWSLTQTLLSPSNQIYARFGYSMEINDSVMIVSSPQLDTFYQSSHYINAGAIHLYSLNQGQWEYQNEYIKPRLKGSYELNPEHQQYGEFMSLYKNVLVVSATEHKEKNSSLHPGFGIVYVYSISKKELTLVDSIYCPDLHPKLRFGYHLKLGPHGLMAASYQSNFSRAYIIDVFNGNAQQLTLPFSNGNVREPHFDQNSSEIIISFQEFRPLDFTRMSNGAILTFKEIHGKYRNTQIVFSPNRAQTFDSLNFYRGFGIGLNVSDSFIICSSPSIFLPTSNWGGDLYFFQPTPCTDSFVSISPHACEWYYSPSRKFHRESAKFLDTTYLPGGCVKYWDIDLTVDFTSEGDRNEVFCEKFVFPSGKSTVIAGNHRDTILNVSGCDSIIHYHLTSITPAADLEITDNGITVAADNVYYHWFDCSDSTIVLENSNEKSFSPPSTGIYAVRVWNNSCEVVSSCVYYEVENKNPGAFSAGPVPSNGTLKVNFVQPQENVSVELTNNIGQTVLKQHFYNYKEIEIQIPHTAGIYYLMVTTESGTEVIKIVR
ncbi:T9SS type A sorting domain-containing protein [bacterium]|nr:T9SS type A sorting domain-containing protein [bacterium]